MKKFCLLGSLALAMLLSVGCSSGSKESSSAKSSVSEAIIHKFFSAFRYSDLKISLLFSY